MPYAFRGSQFRHRRMFCTGLQYNQWVTSRWVTSRGDQPGPSKLVPAPATLDCSQPAAAFLPQQPAAEQQCHRCSRSPGSTMDGPVSRIVQQATLRASVLPCYRQDLLRPRVDTVALFVTSILVCHRHRQGTNADKRRQEATQLRVGNEKWHCRSTKARSTNCPGRGASSHRWGQLRVPSSNKHGIGRIAVSSNSVDRSIPASQHRTVILVPT